jgi:hypothetical protein
MITCLSSERRTLWITIICLVGLVFLTGGCVSPGIQRVVKEDTPPSFSQDQSSSPSSKANFQSVIDQEGQSLIDVEWETYENEDFGYRVLYPGNLTPRDQGKVGEKVLNVTAFVKSSGEVGFTVKVTTDSLDSLSRLGSALVQKTTIGNQPALIKKGTDKLGNTRETIYISDPHNRLITIITSSEVYGKELDQLIERLRNSFSFI